MVFFQNLYGTSKSTLSLDVDVLSCCSCISESSSALLSAPVSKDDIKITLFGIGNDKAPGPDGYTSLFFKSAQSVIGDDFCIWRFRIFLDRGGYLSRLITQLSH